MESVYLQGSEQIQSAAVTMRSAAEDMKRAADSMVYVFDRHERFLNDWLEQLSQTIDRLGVKIDAGT